MRLCLDVTILNEYDGVLAGISRTIFFYLKNLISHNDGQAFSLLLFSEEKQEYRILSYAEAYKLVSKIDKKTAEVSFSSIYSKHALNGDDSILLLGEQWMYNGIFDVLNSIKKDAGCKVVSIVYDIVPHFNPEYYWDGFPEKYVSYLEEVIALSDSILAISESTKRDLESFISEKKLKTLPIKFIRLGDNFFSEKELTAASFQKRRDYMLCVGTIQPRKNPYCIYFAYSQLILELGEENTPDLIFVGSKGWHVDSFYYFVQTNPVLRKKIFFKEKITDRELLGLYEGCLFSIYPSFYEGWGLPIAESASLGKLCIASNSSSMTEIAGDLLDYHSPTDPTELKNKMKKYLLNPDLLKEKEEQLKKKYEVRTWEQFAAETSKFVTSF